MKTKKIYYKVVKPARFYTFVALLLMLLFFGIFKLVNEPIAFAGQETVTELETYVVQKGDTLWHIAQKKNHLNRDVRQLVHEIKRFNNIEDSMVHPGDIIVYPQK